VCAAASGLVDNEIGRIRDAAGIGLIAHATFIIRGGIMGGCILGEVVIGRIAEVHYTHHQTFCTGGSSPEVQRFAF
jgi:hypothetical protein